MKEKIGLLKHSPTTFQAAASKHKRADENNFLSDQKPVNKISGKFGIPALACPALGI